ncbi:MAG: hypothetical protein HY958_07240, partial [Bacteroidia bacterium]|nr:hypothetical protein [Bacteroidia bacterium]
IVSPTGTVDFDGNKIKTHKSVTAKRIILTGDSNNISSPNETINFSDNHISTIGTINGGSLNITGTITANNINVSAYSNPVFAGSGNGIVTFDNNGSFQKLSFNNDANTILLGNGTFGALPANGWTINGNDMYSIPAGNIGIGTTNPVAKLDINGDANISGYLYVQNGVIIGKRVNSEKVITDTVKVKEITADTVKASKTESTAIKSVTVEAKQMTAEKITIDTLLTAKLDLQKMTADSVNTQKIQTSEIKVGNILTIDGGTGKITSSNGNVDFGNNILTTTGSFNANSLKPNGGPLYIQNSTNDIHTLINANNNGYVGIGTDAPIEKLDVAGNANIRGYLYVQDGVIIGKRVNSEKVVTDTAKVGQVEIDKGKIDSLASKQITVDSLKTKDIKTEQFTTQKISSVNITTDSLKATQFTLAEMHADSI